MEEINLEKVTLEMHNGSPVDLIPTLLGRYDEGEGYIPSEAEVRMLEVRNFENTPQMFESGWLTSTLSLTKGETLKVVLPYRNDSNSLTDAARLGLGLINPSEKLIDGGINLDIEDRWEKLEGPEVYTFRRDDLTRHYLLEEMAMEHPLILTKLGHPNYVHSDFARPESEVEEIISGTFRISRERDPRGKAFMSQGLPPEGEGINDEGVLKLWHAGSLSNWASSYYWHSLHMDRDPLSFCLNN